MEHDWRCGTENVSAMLAMAKSRCLLLANEELNVARQQAVAKRIFDVVCQKPKVTMFSVLTPDLLPHVLCLLLLGVRGETIVYVFEDVVIYILSTRLACSKKGTESSTLAASYTDPKMLSLAIWVSLDEANTLDEAELFKLAFDTI